MTRLLLRYLASFLCLAAFYVAFQYARPDDELSPSAKNFHARDATSVPAADGAEIALISLTAPANVEPAQYAVAVAQAYNNSNGLRSAGRARPVALGGRYPKTKLEELDKLECLTDDRIPRTPSARCGSNEEMESILRGSILLPRLKQAYLRTSFSDIRA